MGAETFFQTASGKTAADAFKAAREEALYDYGHSGYTGSIAEKNEFTLIPLPAGKKPMDYAQELIDVDDERIDDKWGPAGCLHVSDNKWLFFGWASS
jgi:hypothetical protein